MAYDTAILASGAALQVNACLWTYRHHTPVLTHGVAAVAASEMLLPLAVLVYQHCQGQTPGAPPAASLGPWTRAAHTTCKHATDGLQSVWSGVTYGLWLGTLASQLGVASLWGMPLAVGACVLGATCTLGVLVYGVMPQSWALEKTRKRWRFWCGCKGSLWRHACAAASI